MTQEKPFSSSSNYWLNLPSKIQRELETLVTSQAEEDSLKTAPKMCFHPIVKFFQEPLSETYTAQGIKRYQELELPTWTYQFRWHPNLFARTLKTLGILTEERWGRLKKELKDNHSFLLGISSEWSHFEEKVQFLIAQYDRSLVSENFIDGYYDQESEHMFIERYKLNFIRNKVFEYQRGSTAL